MIDKTDTQEPVSRLLFRSVATQERKAVEAQWAHMEEVLVRLECHYFLTRRPVRDFGSPAEVMFDVIQRVDRIAALPLNAGTDARITLPQIKPVATILPISAPEAEAENDPTKALWGMPPTRAQARDKYVVVETDNTSAFSPEATYGPANAFPPFHPLPAVDYIRLLKDEHRLSRQWQRIYAAFEMVGEWFSYREISALVNYLVAVRTYGNDAVPALIARVGTYIVTARAYQYKVRRLRAELRSMIEHSLAERDSDGRILPVDRLCYRHDRRDTAIRNIHTLANALYECRHGRRYDFARHIAIDETEAGERGALGGWTLEHIRPITVRTLAHDHERRDWCRTHAEWLRANHDRLLSGPNRDRIAIDLPIASHAIANFARADFLPPADFSKTVEYFDGLLSYDRYALIDRPGNLTLLSRADRPAFDGAYFSQKKERAEVRIMEGAFIPPITLKVLRKQFPGARREFDFWSEWDRDAYFAFILNTITDENGRSYYPEE